MHIHDDVVLAVHCPVLAVIKPIRFSVPALLPAFRVCQAFRFFFSSSRWWIIVMVERFFPQDLSVQIDLFIQLLHILFRSLLHIHDPLPVLVRFCFDVRRICIQDLSSDQSLFYTLLQYLIEYLFSYVIIFETPYTVYTYRCVVRSFLA